jgi:hypothetical protein
MKKLVLMLILGIFVLNAKAAFNDFAFPFTVSEEETQPFLFLEEENYESYASNGEGISVFASVGECTTCAALYPDNPDAYAVCVEDSVGPDGLHDCGDPNCPLYLYAHLNSPIGSSIFLLPFLFVWGVWKFYKRKK